MPYADDRFRRRAVRITRVRRGRPIETRDTLELELECGHRRPFLVPRANGRPVSYRPLLGCDFQCPRCSRLGTWRRRSPEASAPDG